MTIDKLLSSMFNTENLRVKKLAEIFPERIKELETIFVKETFVYIDFSNIFYWQERLGWHIDIVRVKQLLNSFGVKNIRIYVGTLKGDHSSECMINDFGKGVETKPVKIIPLSIDMRGVSLSDPTRLKNFIHKPLLKKFDLETIEFLNSKLIELNKKNVYIIEKHKCNFDVEIGSQIKLDVEKNSANNFVLWSGDSDFAAPIKNILSTGKTATIFATSRRVTDELNIPEVLIFDIKKIKEFICFPRDIPDDIKKKITP